jgi:hypothetical protein
MLNHRRTDNRHCCSSAYTEAVAVTNRAFTDLTPQSNIKTHIDSRIYTLSLWMEAVDCLSKEATTYLKADGSWQNVKSSDYTTSRTRIEVCVLPPFRRFVTGSTTKSGIIAFNTFLKCIGFSLEIRSTIRRKSRAELIAGASGSQLWQRGEILRGSHSGSCDELPSTPVHTGQTKLACAGSGTTRSTQRYLVLATQ